MIALLQSNAISPMRAQRSLVRWILRFGRPVGIVLVVVPIICGVLLYGASASRSPSSDAWPTEGYYFAGVQYQLHLQALRLEIARYHLATDLEAERFFGGTCTWSGKCFTPITRPSWIRLSCGPFLRL